MILGIVMCQASPIGSKVLGLKFKVGKGAGKGVGIWSANQDSHGFPHWQGNFKVKIWYFWIGFGKLGFEASPIGRVFLGLNLGLGFGASTILNKDLGFKFELIRVLKLWPGIKVMKNV